VHFDEQWMSPAQIAVLAGLAQSTSHLPGEVVEVGTWQGWSAVPLANAIVPAFLHVVDHWEGDGPESAAAGIGINPELVKRDNYGIFQANIAEGTAGNVITWKMGWRKFAELWDKPIRFLHLDAAHTTQEVSDNLAALLPRAVPGAIFAGDDWDFPTVAAGVREQFTDDRINVQFNKLWWVVL
jgi:hypothetical protein